MAISIATNTKNDIYLGPDKNLALVRDINAVMQDCEHAMKALFQEMVYAYNRGIPYFDVVFDQLNISQFEGVGILTLLRVAGVRNVIDFTASLSGSVLSYTAEIETIYGTENLVGTIDG